MDTKTKPLYMLSTRDPPQNKGHIQTNSEGLGKQVFHTKGDQKKAGVAILISDKIDWNKGCEKRQRRTLNNDQRINIRRSYDNYKYIYAPNIGAYKYIYAPNCNM